MVDYKIEGSRLLKYLRDKGHLKQRWKFRNGKNYRQNFFDLESWARKKGYIKQKWRTST